MRSARSPRGGSPPRGGRPPAPRGGGDPPAFPPRGWSAGFPLVPPTPRAVDAMLRGTTRDPGEVIATLEPGFGIATVEKLAINAVMAGWAPAHLPLLLAG